MYDQIDIDNGIWFLMKARDEPQRFHLDKAEHITTGEEIEARRQEKHTCKIPWCRKNADCAMVAHTYHGPYWIDACWEHHHLIVHVNTKDFRYGQTDTLLSP